MLARSLPRLPYTTQPSPPMNRPLSAIALVAVLALAGCSALGSALEGRPLSLIHIQSAEIQAPDASQDDAYQALSRAFLDRGYDIKSSDRDAGYITTEYKRYASYGSEPPFDFSLQIRAVVEETPRGVVVELRPTMKQQNRRNAAAYSEEELGYYRFDDNTALAGDYEPWREDGLREFMNIVSDLSDEFDVAQEDVVMNETRTLYRLRLGQVVPA